MPFVCACPSPWSGGPRRPGSELLSVRPKSPSLCLSTVSGADIPVVGVQKSLLEADDNPAAGGKRSVWTLIGRSGERNSTDPPNRLDCAVAGRIVPLGRSQLVMPFCTVDCMLNDRSFLDTEALVHPLDLLRGFPDLQLRTKVYPSKLTRGGDDF